MAHSRGIIIVAALMIAFGCAEVVTAFTHNFFGVQTETGALPTVVGAALGTLYVIAGLLVLTQRRQATIAAIVLLIVIVVGRIVMVVTGLFPVTNFKQAAAMAAGTAVAAGFAIYLGLKTAAFE